MKKIFFIFLICLNAFSATKTISFEQDQKKFNADFTSVNPKKKTPLVIIVHEWWGKNDYVQMRAKMLNKVGYSTLVVDLFGDGVLADDPKKASELAGPFYKEPQLGIDRLAKYLDLVKIEESIDPNQIYVIGYCFGGTQALNFARSGANIKGVVSFHGALGTTIKADKLKAKVLVLHGEADPFVPEKEAVAFKEEMKAVGAALTFIGYPGATHAFTNPKSTETGKKYNIPVAYHQKADLDSWKQLKKFIK